MYLLTHRCIKCRLLSLLRYLNYVIPLGRSSISHLLSLSSTIPFLHDYITLDDSCNMQLRMLRNIFSSWNGNSYFYDERFTRPEDIQLYKDAAPSVGFGGYWMVRPQLAPRTVLTLPVLCPLQTISSHNRHTSLGERMV